MRFAAIFTFSADQIGFLFAGKRSSGITISPRIRPRTSKATGATFKIMKLEKPSHLTFTMWVFFDKQFDDVDFQAGWTTWKRLSWLTFFMATTCYHDERLQILSFLAIVPSSRRVCLKFPSHLKKICFIQIFRINFHTSPHNTKLSTKIQPKNSTRTNSKRSCQSRTTMMPCHRVVPGTLPTASATRKPRASTRRRTRGSQN